MTEYSLTTRISDILKDVLPSILKDVPRATLSEKYSASYVLEDESILVTRVGNLSMSATVYYQNYNMARYSLVLPKLKVNITLGEILKYVDTAMIAKVAAHPPTKIPKGMIIEDTDLFLYLEWIRSCFSKKEPQIHYESLGKILQSVNGLVINEKDMHQLLSPYKHIPLHEEWEGKVWGGSRARFPVGFLKNPDNTYIIARKDHPMVKRVELAQKMGGI